MFKKSFLFIAAAAIATVTAPVAAQASPTQSLEEYTQSNLIITIAPNRPRPKPPAPKPPTPQPPRPNN